MVAKMLGVILVGASLLIAAPLASVAHPGHSHGQPVVPPERIGGGCCWTRVAPQQPSFSWRDFLPFRWVARAYEAAVSVIIGG